MEKWRANYIEILQSKIKLKLINKKSLPILHLVPRLIPFRSASHFLMPIILNGSFTCFQKNLNGIPVVSIYDKRVHLAHKQKKTF